MQIRIRRAVSPDPQLLRQADSAGITLDPVEWQSIEAFYRASVDTLRNALGLNSDVTDSTLSPAQRSEVAALKVDDFFTRISQGQAILRRLPSSLSTILRERSGYRVYPNGVARAVELAVEARTPPGSKTPSTVPPPTMEPAEGPPPVPGAEGSNTPEAAPKP